MTDGPDIHDPRAWAHSIAGSLVAIVLALALVVVLAKLMLVLHHWHEGVP